MRTPILSVLVILGKLVLSSTSFAISFLANSLSASLSADRTAPRWSITVSKFSWSFWYSWLSVPPAECQDWYLFMYKIVYMYSSTSVAIRYFYIIMVTWRIEVNTSKYEGHLCLLLSSTTVPCLLVRDSLLWLWQSHWLHLVLWRPGYGQWDNGRCTSSRVARVGKHTLKSPAMHTRRMYICHGHRGKNNNQKSSNTEGKTLSTNLTLRPCNTSFFLGCILVTGKYNLLPLHLLHHLIKMS